MQRIAFHKLLQRMIKIGTLHVIDYTGRKSSYHGSSDIPAITMKLHTSNITTRLMLNPDLALGEGYMSGEISVEGGSIYDLLFIVSINLKDTNFSITESLYKLWQRKFKAWASRISPTKAKKNVAHHYDLPASLYDLFLDDDWQYSCAYFHTLDHDLNTAQVDKKRHLAAKLSLRPGQTVLDIGCGWGGLALYLAKIANVKVVGLTLSEEQYKYATERVKAAGLEGQVQFRLQDYRSVTGTFDRIVSVGMFEHVGLAHYKTFFNKVHELLAKDGVALLHSIGAEYDPGISSPWISKYIFPGGYIPTLSEVLPAIEQQRFHITDIEILHHHYATTLKAWRHRFLLNREKLPQHLDEKFVRMWEYYLACSQVSFENRMLMNFQIQLMKNKTIIPLTRDYIYESEHGLTRHKTETAEVIPA